MVPVVRDKQIAKAVHGYGARIIQHCIRGNPTITTEPSRSRTGHSDDPTRGLHHLTDPVFVRFRDEQIPRAVYHHRFWVIQERIGGE